ncbi:PX domain-containing protein kinase-like protein isoform X1 [Hermetia illucens]|nr:PX domain-containing protein kinase-like protein isoform X1 [Hermetia illucens]
MAIFEKRFERKVTLDDTQPITCVIETAQLVDGHTEYVLRLQRGPYADTTWKVLRRYNDFVQLNKSLSPSGISLPLPGKKVIGNMRPDFIAERRQGLQEYINVVLMNPILASSLAAKRFVDPDSYSSPFHDQAQQSASLCLRTEGLYILGQSMGLIGWRIRKHYFKVLTKSQGQSGGKHLIKSSSQTHNKQHHQQSSNGSSDGGSSQSSSCELVLSWTEYGPDKYIDDKEMHSIFKSLAGLQHPYIEPLQYSACNENGALVIRKFHQQGTLKDILCMSTPKKPFLNKYGNPKGRTALSLRQVATYGRQILEALRFLHSKGMPYGHLHSGNIVIIDDTVRLLDVENIILGVPAFYRPFFVQHSKIHTPETIDVYCFGHVLFEMSMGYPLQESVARQITDCPEALKNLLEMILSKEACKSALPTLDQLAEHRFFQEYASSLSESLNTHGLDSAANSKPHFKLSMNAKEQIRIAMQKSEHRLREEQKSVKNQKRLVRVQEMMSSEEEKKKSKQKAKMEHKQAKLRQQNSLQLHNGSGGPSASPINRTDSVISVNMSNETTPAPSVQSASPLPPPPPPPTNPLESTVGTGISTSIEETDCERSALLESICKFNRGSLRKVRSND